MVVPLGVVSKTYALLLEPLRWVHVPGFTAAIFRRTSTQVRNPGGLWSESHKLYDMFNATARAALLEWEFASGAIIRFGHMEHADDRFNWQGAQICMLGFDELSHFKREVFFYMLSRNRSATGVRPYVRATLNPVPRDDPQGGWIHEFVDWYIGEDGYAIEERCGKLRYFVNYNDKLHWADTAEELKDEFPGILPKSFTFIKSSVYDNQILLTADPGYVSNLMALNPIDRERLLGQGRRGGNWRIREEAGKVFNRHWVTTTPTMIDGAGKACLFWDFAATERQINKPDPDYTAAVLIQQVPQLVDGNLFFVGHCFAFQKGPAETDRNFVEHTMMVAKEMKRLKIPFCVRWEIEPGSAGKRDNRRLVSALAGLDAKGVYSRGDKMLRGKPFAAQAEAGNVQVVQAPWNEDWLRHMHNFPGGAHDDIWDATAGAFNELVEKVPMRPARSFQG
jgi:predicted phage terminase large subunit-like protein